MSNEAAAAELDRMLADSSANEQDNMSSDQISADQTSDQINNHQIDTESTTTEPVA